MPEPFTGYQELKTKVLNALPGLDSDNKHLLHHEPDALLHIASSKLAQRDNRIIDDILEKAPDILEKAPHMLEFTKTDKPDLEGQTPLHILIARKNKGALRKIGEVLKNEDKKIKKIKETVFKTKATGKAFTNTIMEGQLHHIVAALTLDKEIFKIVFEMSGNKIEDQNNHGNTVYHCLIQHAARCPEDIQDVIDMWKYVSSYISTQYPGDDACLQYVLRIPNNANMQPLQLAAKLAVNELFKLILEMEKIPNAEDSLFDAYMFDVTVIDTATNYIHQHTKRQKQQSLQDGSKTNQVSPQKQDGGKNSGSNLRYPESVLEILAKSPVTNSIHDMLLQPPVKKLIYLKWERCKWQLFVWMIFHVSLMIWYSAYAVYWAGTAFPETTSNTTESQSTFVFVSPLFFLVVDVVYSVLVTLLVVSKCMRLNFKQRHVVTLVTCSAISDANNLEYIVLLSLFSTCLYVHCIWQYIELAHTSTFLLISNLSGWWFCIFFFRAFKPISFYVAMIKRVIFGDLLRFAVFLVLAVVSFSIAFHVLFQGPTSPTIFDDESVNDTTSIFGRTLYRNIKLMFGLADIEVLSEARSPLLAYTLYIFYVVMTYLVLINSLIAMMSETCSMVRANEAAFFHAQKLSVILFLEEIQYPFWGMRDDACCQLFNQRPPTPFKEHTNSHMDKDHVLYFLKMTNDDPEEDVHGSENNDDLIDSPVNPPVKMTEITHLQIHHPYYEETIGVNGPEYALKYKEQQQKTFAKVV